MAKVSIPPAKLPWREKDIQSGDHKLLADYLKILVKTLQKKLKGPIKNMAFCVKITEENVFYGFRKARRLQSKKFPFCMTVKSYP